MSDIELSAKLDRWIDDNTVDSDFIAHPDFVYDKLLELETEIKKLQAESAELTAEKVKKDFFIKGLLNEINQTAGTGTIKASGFYKALKGDSDE